MELNDAIARYIAVRDKKQELEREHKERLLPLNEVLRKMENLFLGILNEQQAQNIKTDAGTILKNTKTNVKVDDWEEVLHYIRENEAWDALDRRISKTFVEDMAEQETPVPGVSLTRTVVAQIRRS
jgi:hypothetical protein